MSSGWRLSSRPILYSIVRDASKSDTTFAKLPSFVHSPSNLSPHPEPLDSDDCFSRRSAWKIELFPELFAPTRTVSGLSSMSSR
jgi:hypothetical protein